MGRMETHREFNVQFLKEILEPPQSAFPCLLESWKSNGAKEDTQSQSLFCRNINHLTERKADVCTCVLLMPYRPWMFPLREKLGGVGGGYGWDVVTLAKARFVEKVELPF